MSDFYRRRDVKASRRDRRCDDCCKWILKGSPYHYLTGVSDRDFHVLGYCPECMAQSDELARVREEERRQRQIENQKRHEAFRERMAAAAQEKGKPE